MEEVGASRVEVGNPKMVIGFVLTRKYNFNWAGVFHVCSHLHSSVWGILVCSRSCGNMNFARRNSCNQCGEPRPEDSRPSGGV